MIFKVSEWVGLEKVVQERLDVGFSCACAAGGVGLLMGMFFKFWCEQGRHWVPG